ncbi:MAG: hypothetical protein GXO36_03370, partial [Chloroflexi bacterium]|nr:hypothetical protein [Chloroflexota bacterium]
MEFDATLQRLTHTYGLRLIEPKAWAPAELLHLDQALARFARVLRPAHCLASLFANLRLQRREDIRQGALARRDEILFHPRVLSQNPPWLAQVAIVHELAHVWAFRS